MKALTVNQSHTLVQILATENALWRPFRWRHGGAASVASEVHLRRTRFGRDGVPLVIGGATARRLAGFRELTDLTTRGLIRQHVRGKRIGVSLTGLGRDVAAALTGAYSVRDSWGYLRQLELAREATDVRHPRQYIPEPHVVGLADWGDAAALEIGHLEQLLAPLLVAGLASSASDVEGRVGYRLEAAGEEQLDKPRPRSRKGLPPYDPLLGDLFDEFFREFCEDRESWRCGDPALVQIPLGAGSWPSLKGAEHG